MWHVGHLSLLSGIKKHRRNHNHREIREGTSPSPSLVRLKRSRVLGGNPVRHERLLAGTEEGASRDEFPPEPPADGGGTP